MDTLLGQRIIQNISASFRHRILTNINNAYPKGEENHYL